MKETKEKPKREKKRKGQDYYDQVWEMQFFELKKFKKKFGHCDVSLGIIRNPYLLLGYWCVHQRQQKKFTPLKFHPDRERRLNELGFSWNILDKKFEEGFKQLLAFKKKYGHVDVPHHNSKYHDLYLWIGYQRERRLNPKTYYESERERRLTEIGFSWTPIDEKFEKRFAELVAFKKKYGHCNLAQYTKEYSALCKWANYQRLTINSRKHYEPERKRRLTEIGFLWNPLDELFEKKFEELKKYYRLNGHCKVLPSENPQLAEWCRRMRLLRMGKMKLGLLSLERIKKLDSLKFEWECPEDLRQKKFEDKWEEKFFQLKTYKEKFGSFVVKKDINGSLFRWVAKQKSEHKCKRLPPKRLKMLNDIGFNWERGKRITIKSEDLLHELKRLHSLLNKFPNSHHIKKFGKYSPTTFINRFGSLENAYELSGLERK